MTPLQVQERLIKNKTLLTAIEPAIACTSLEVLIGILQRRIELDKEVRSPRLPLPKFVCVLWILLLFL